MLYYIVVAIMVIVVIFTVYTAEKNFFNKSYETYLNYIKNQDNVTNISFKNFRDYYLINKEKWKLNKERGAIYYDTGKGRKRIYIHFSYPDWIKSIYQISDELNNKPNSFNNDRIDNMKELLECVQEDIEEIREQASAEMRQGREAFMKIKGNLEKEATESVDMLGKMDMFYKDLEG